MEFRRIIPPSVLSRFIECYWTAQDDSTIPKIEKIIPDGFLEIIFHFGDTYRICLGSTWARQEKNLIAGQIDKYFYLENTGESDILAVKLKPAALAQWYGLRMDTITNQVVDFRQILLKEVELVHHLRKAINHEQRIAILNNYFAHLNSDPSKAEAAVDLILKSHGMVSVSDLCDQIHLGERQLENIFKRDIGLSPKKYARIIRFNYIFECIRANKSKGIDLALEAAYYDQSHFIRNFRDFTGESPGDYGFDTKNLANFFLMKK